MSRFSIPVLSLFCGCGGMDLGFRLEGFDPVLAIDINEPAIASYNWNRKRRIAVSADLASTTGADVIRLLRQTVPNTRLRGVIGGPPCQSFSIGNVHGKPDDPRSELPRRYAEILSALNKEFTLDFFVFENVVGLKSNRHKEDLTRFLALFGQAGFQVFEGELNASAFEVAQNRKRVFLVGINKQLYPNIEFNFPAGNPNNPVTVREAIDGLPAPTFFNRKVTRKDIPYHPNHWTMNPKSAKFTNGSSKTGRSFRRLKWDQPSWAVAYGHREIHVHPNGARRLSIFEAMLLQGFPNGYELLGNLTQQVEQVSNAVPPPLASAIARTLRRMLYERVDEIQKNLLQWFKQNQRAFPWRKSRDPYRILLAEKLLQQTAATPAVVVAYTEILRSYPTLSLLSEAKPIALRRIIGQLGFAYRADELPKLAKTIVTKHKSTIPKGIKELLDLPGVGDYAARAILSFAHEQDVPIVDTNIARLLHRVFGLEGPLPSNPARNKRLIRMASALIPKGQSRNFNLAALDLCAAICTARKPNCAICPIREQCDWSRQTKTLEEVDSRSGEVS